MNKKRTCQKQQKTSKRFVIVCTHKGGVFFGQLLSRKSEKMVILGEAQMCIYWSGAERGVFGLASSGPGAGCRITAPTLRVTLYGVSAILDVGQKAAKAWKSAPWSE